MEIAKLVVHKKRSFFWDKVCHMKKIAWVRWSNVCKPKYAKGLSVNDLRMMNLST